MTIIFVIIIAVFLAAIIISPDKKYSAEENRMLETRPDATITSITSGRFMNDFENYTNDQLPLRNMWIRIKTTSDMLMGKTESNGVYRCRDGYLMETFQPPEKRNFDSTMTAMKKFSGRYKKLKKYFLLAPNAANILSDKLPSNAPAADQNRFMDKVFSTTGAAGIKSIDVRDTLRSHRDRQLYYHSDHHWTTDGAWYSFLQASKTMGLKGSRDLYSRLLVANDFKGSLESKSGYYMCKNDDIYIYYPKKAAKRSVVNYVDEQKKITSFYKTANLKKKDAYTVFFNGNPPCVKIDTPVKTTRRLLVFKDSYANCFVPFLSQYYRRIVMVDPRYYYSNINDLIDSEQITDVLFLYNANTFSQDTSLSTMLSN